MGFNKGEKIKYYEDLFNHTVNSFVESPDKWIDFLNLSSKMYKQNFMNQVLIFAQKPEVTAVAEYDFWNVKMHRYIKRGSKGIALIDQSGQNSKLKYLFDVSDTGRRKQSKNVYLWNLKEFKGGELKEVSESLLNKYEISETDSEKNKGFLEIEDIIKLSAASAVKKYFENNRSFYENFNDRKESYLNLIVNSVCYVVCKRCDIKTERYENDIISEIKGQVENVSQINLIGTSVEKIGFDILYNIEKAVYSVKNNIRDYARGEKSEERNSVQESRRLSVSGSGINESGEGKESAAFGEIRNDEKELSSGEQRVDDGGTDGGREIGEPPERSRSDGETKSGSADETIIGGESGAGQENSSVGMGTAYERSEADGGIDDIHGADIQLIPSQQEQISFIDNMENSEAENSEISVFNFSQDIIDDILRNGFNDTDGKSKVISEFSKLSEKVFNRRADFLKTVYHGGYGLVSDKGNISARYSEDGIHISYGKKVRYNEKAQIISWENAANRINQLLEKGEFAENFEVLNAIKIERMRIAESLINIKWDLSDEAEEKDYLSFLNKYDRLSFGEKLERIADDLENTEILNDFAEKYNYFYGAYTNNSKLVRFNNLNKNRIEKLVEELKELNIERAEFSGSPIKQVKSFITDDEIDEALKRGSGFVEGKRRIYEFFSEYHSKEEKIAFLKNEYGTGGRTHALSDAPSSSEDHSSKGIVYKKD